MIFVELQNAALGDSFDSSKYRDRVKRWVNEAQRRIARRVEQDTLVVSTTVGVTAGTSAATFADPSVLQKLESVTWLQGGVSLGPLTPMDLGDLDDYDADYGLGAGVPDVYSKQGGAIEFRPAALVAGSLKIRYRRLPAALSGDSDQPELHEDYHDLMAMWARAKCFRDEDDKQMHDSLMADFENELARLRTDLQGSNDDGPRQVRGTF